VSTTFEQRSDRRVLELESGGAAVEAVGGLGVIVLSILGLINLAPVALGAVAGIVFGVAILAEGSAIAAEYSKLLSQAGGDMLGEMELGSGMTAEIMAGGAAMVLGVLALLQIEPEILLPALVIVGGAGLIFAAGAMSRLNNIKLAAKEQAGTAQHLLHAATAGAAGSQILAGIGAIVLGIIALASSTGGTYAVASAAGAWVTLSLVGLLVLGAAIMMSGGSLTSRFVQILNRRTSQS